MKQLEILRLALLDSQMRVQRRAEAYQTIRQILLKEILTHKSLKAIYERDIKFKSNPELRSEKYRCINFSISLLSFAQRNGIKEVFIPKYLIQKK